MSLSLPNGDDAFAANPRSRLSTLPLGYPQYTLGEAVAAWMHEWLIQPNGPRARKPFRLTLDQYRFLLWWYAVDDQGRWLFHRGARRKSKGTGKSPFGGVWCLGEFCGPVRLDRFDDRVPGGCRGKPVDMPLVQIAATAESQTANTMRMVRAFAPKGSPIVEHYWIDVGKTQYYKQPEGTLHIITSSVTAAEGAEASAILGDETEHWKPSNDGPDLASTLLDNVAKSGSRMIETSNAWVPGIECVAESTWDAWVLQEEGRLVGETKILYDAVMAPPTSWRYLDEAQGGALDLDALREGLEFVYADCEWKRDPNGQLDVRPMLQRILDPASKPSESKRKYLNWPSVDEDAWTSPEAWLELAAPDVKVGLDDEIALFFDGSKSRDATAFVACRISDGHVFVPRDSGGIDTIWEPDPGKDDDVVPTPAVDAALAKIMATYNVVGFFGDVREWESFVKIAWPGLYGDRLRVWAVKEGKDPQQIAWDMRGHVYDFTLGCELVLDEIGKQGFTHDDNPKLARHVANARRRPNRYGVSIGKESPDSPLKIDAAVAMVGVRLVRRLVLAAPKPKTKAGRVWGE